MKKEAGRHAIDTAYRVRAMAWFNAVSLASGKNDSELEVLFGDSNNRQRYTPGARPGLWRKYKMGSTCPKLKPDINGRPSIVERVDARFPGTAKWMTMPFWDVLSYTPLEMSELKKIYLSLSPPVRDLIVMELPTRNMMFWRRPIEDETLCQQLLDIGDLDAATAILALIKEAESAQTQYMHLYWLKCWISYSKKLQQHPVLAPLLNNIHMIIEDRFTRISYAGSDGNYFRLTKESMRKVLRGEVPVSSVSRMFGVS